MTKVFIGGSRHIRKLPSAMLERLDRIVDKALQVMVGDAAGVDRAVQAHLPNRGYQSVEVFCSGNRARHNLGDWPIRAVAVANGLKGRAVFEVKDRAMTAEASYGLMIWDAKSLGTAMNTARLLRMGRKVVLFVAPWEAFHELRTERDWLTLVMTCDRAIRDAFAEDSLAAETSHCVPTPEMDRAAP